MDGKPGENLLRSFMAIPLDAATRQLAAHLQRGLQDEIGKVRWSRPETLHLTLRFFGDIAAESLEKAAKTVLSVNALGPPFELPLQGLGAFPSPTRPRVLWMGFAASPELQRLYARLEALLAEAGIPPETRPFTPHLTLGRARGRLPDVAPLLQRLNHDVRGGLPVERVIIYRSRLRPGGAEHTPLHTFTLHA